MLTQKSNAPDFTLFDQAGTSHSLHDAKGRWLLLYFYPKDDTPGCTKEACAIRDAWRQFSNRGVVVFGVSADSVEKHGKFSRKYSLPFSILSDSEKTVIKAYNAWGRKKFMGREYMGIRRISYLINPEGRIAKVYENVRPAEHAGEVLKDIPQ